MLRSKWTAKPNGKPNSTLNGNNNNYYAVPTIVIDSPESSIASQSNLPYADEVDGGITDEEVDGIAESEDKVQRVRRNSISLPSELNKLELEKLRHKYNEKENKQKQQQLRVEVSQDMLDSTNSNPGFINTIITGDESWVYGYDPETSLKCCLPATDAIDLREKMQACARRFNVGSCKRA